MTSALATSENAIGSLAMLAMIVLPLAGLEPGFLTLLVGLNIFRASCRFKRPVLEVCAAARPMMAILGIGVLITPTCRG